MHIEWIGSKYLEPAAPDLDCDERVNLFIGPNASGKSRILRAMKTLHSFAFGRSLPEHTDYEIGTITNDDKGCVWFHEAANDDPTFAMRTSADWTRDPPDSGFARWDAVPFLYIPSTRVNLPAQHIFNRMLEKPDDEESDDPLNRLFDTDAGVFDGRHVELAIAWLHENAWLHGDWQLRRSQSIQAKKALSVGFSCAKSICSEVIYDNASHNFVEIGDLFDEGVVVHHEMGIGTSDDVLGGPLYAGALSSGTQSTLLWVWALALKIASHYDWTPGWEAKSAVLLIDEIENHLHPTWQRRVIPALLEHFPGLQIFAATHSPFVVAGCKAGQVHLLSRGEDGHIAMTTNTEDVIGWTVDEILRTMMGVDDPTDQETAAAAQELRKLRAQGTLADPREEEGRQQRM